MLISQVLLHFSRESINVLETLPEIQSLELIVVESMVVIEVVLHVFSIKIIGEIDYPASNFAECILYFCCVGEALICQMLPFRAL